ncbi:hypothetical protein QVD17_09576 [Tagetes erecta]|uniref:Uncharacterized protein n=1 Tax=Tagetes erecta TaxID=13708 RepID=A0AAD8P429_TARER|nr:hypothetical protein QVD17_09576 [Tagetes erecta]
MLHLHLLIINNTNIRSRKFSVEGIKDLNVKPTIISMMDLNNNSNLQNVYRSSSTHLRPPHTIKFSPASPSSLPSPTSPNLHSPQPISSTVYSAPVISPPLSLFGVSLLSVLRTDNLPSKAKSFDIQDIIFEAQFYGIDHLLVQSHSNPSQFEPFNLEKSKILPLSCDLGKMEKEMEMVENEEEEDEEVTYKKRWSFAKPLKEQQPTPSNDTVWLRSYMSETEQEQNKHAIAIAAATAVAVNATVAAAQAARRCASH